MNKNEISKENKIVMGAAIVIVAVIIIFAIVNTNIAGTNTYSNTPSKYDSFAECLANAGATMYGSASCPHCQALKATFGNSFRFVKYVECPNNTQLCIDKGVQYYPTWIMGTTTIDIGFDGDKTMNLLASSTGCVLPQ